jgi:serine/threonine-protein kinase
MAFQRHEMKAGSLVAGKYELVRELARGGMGSVWVAHHRQLDAEVAIKFMDTELAESAEARARFEREARAAAALRSPHVVQMLDYGVDEGVPFIVMELLVGEDLRMRLKRQRRLRLDEAAPILTQACKALRIAADASIVHRDLKPANVFITRVGDDEVVKILDFGVAKSTSRPAGEGTTTGMLLGTPHYMSPEQARGGKQLDHRSDLWSLTVILYQMITGRKPFDGDEIGDVIVKICTEHPPSVRTYDPTLPPALDGFFERALSVDPNDRFQSARALAEELTAIARSAGVDVPSLSGRSVVQWRPPSEAPERGGTLTLATGSLPVTPRSSKRAIVFGLAAGALVVIALAVVMGRGGAAPPPAPAAPAQGSPSPAEPASAEEAPAPTATASAAATASATATAPATATAAPPRAAPPRPPPKRPSGKGSDPVLGF